MKALLLILAAALLALKLSAAQVQVVVYPPDPPFPSVYVVFAEQLQHHSISIRASPTMQGPVSDWTEIGFYACYPDRQWVSATHPVVAQQMFFRSINTNCGGDAPLAWVPPEPDLEWLLRPLD